MTDEEQVTPPVDEPAPEEAPARKPPTRRIEYSEAVAAEFCERIACGESPSKVCEDPEMPSLRAIMKWQQTKPEFRQALALARDFRADLRAQQIEEMADQVRTGKLDYNSGRVAIAAHQWLASKEGPRRYGDKIVAEHTGLDGGPIQIEANNDASLMRAARWVADLLDKAGTVDITEALALEAPAEEVEPPTGDDNSGGQP